MPALANASQPWHHVRLPGVPSPSGSQHVFSTTTTMCAGGSSAYHAVWAYGSLCMAVFLVRTMKRVIFQESHTYSECSCVWREWAALALSAVPAFRGRCAWARVTPLCCMAAERPGLCANSKCKGRHSEPTHCLHPADASGAGAAVHSTPAKGCLCCCRACMLLPSWQASF